MDKNKLLDIASINLGKSSVVGLVKAYQIVIPISHIFVGRILKWLWIMDIFNLEINWKPWYQITQMLILEKYRIKQIGLWLATLTELPKIMGLKRLKQFDQPIRKYCHV